MLQKKTQNKGEQDALTEEIASLKSHIWSLEDCNQNCSSELAQSEANAIAESRMHEQDLERESQLLDKLQASAGTS